MALAAQGSFGDQCTLLLKQAPALLLLPESILIDILLFLPTPEIVHRVELVCLTLWKVARNELLWKKLYVRDYATRPSHFKGGRGMCDTSWTTLYRCRQRSGQICVQRYQYEPQHVQELYLDMETALACLSSGEGSGAAHSRTSKRALQSAEKPSGLDNRKFNDAHECRTHRYHMERPLSGKFSVCLDPSLRHACYGATRCSHMVLSDTDPGCLVCPITGRVISTAWQPNWNALQSGAACLALDVYADIMSFNRERQHKIKEYTPNPDSFEADATEELKTISHADSFLSERFALKTKDEDTGSSAGDFIDDEEFYKEEDETVNV